LSSGRLREVPDGLDRPSTMNYGTTRPSLLSGASDRVS
jgi:hypothetical protein